MKYKTFLLYRFTVIHINTMIGNEIQDFPITFVDLAENILVHFIYVIMLRY